MPYQAFKRGDEWLVFTVDEDGNPVGDAHGAHVSEDEANAQIRALYANVKEMTDADKKRLDEVYARYHDTVNMSASQLEAWADTEYSKAASLDRTPIARNLRLLRKAKANWTMADVRDANRTISFVRRMKGVTEGKPVSQDIPYSKREISLKNWAYDPGQVREMEATGTSFTQAQVDYQIPSPVEGERCGLCAHFQNGRCVTVENDPLQIVEPGWCEAYTPNTLYDFEDETVRELMREMRTFDMPTNGVPVVETYAEVDVPLLTRGDDDPFYIVLPIARVGEVSGNDLYYDESLVDALAEQLKGLGGIRGHIPDEQRSTAYPISDVHWVGHRRVGETLWAKGYIPPGETREDIRRIKARRGKLSTSIYGSGVPVRDESGHRRLMYPVFEQVDLAPAARAAVNLGGEFEIVSEMQGEKQSMETNSIQTTLAEMDDNALFEAIGGERLAKVVEMYLKKNGKRMVASEMVDSVVSQSARIQQLEQERDVIAETLRASNAQLEMHREREFYREADTVVAEMLSWNIQTEEGKSKLGALRTMLRNRVMSKLPVRDLDMFRELAVKEMADPEFGMIATSMRDALAGVPAIQATRANKPTDAERGRLFDPDFRKAAHDTFGF